MNYRSLKQAILPLLVVGYTPSAFAYIDPGTGSMLVQGLLAGVAGIFIVMKMYWYKIKKFFFPQSAQGATEETESRPESPEEKP